ncbi:hypothetical protein [Caloranaerobacter ferrireducens]|uniref:hypothetical protein n=1 Tax=Caloranaerobacter ferrireducens TaxID=1323370 RepID=UPI00084D7F56|nr:hypothetical protein [Caloranaerobacter ferrireducens]
MKNRINKFIIILFCIFIFLLFSIYKHEFVLMSAPILHKFEIDENYYLGYFLESKGFLTPVLKDANFLKKDGTILSKKSKDEYLIDVLIDTKNHTGIVRENDISKKINNYIPIDNYVVKNKTLNLVFRFKIKKEEAFKDIEAIILDYTILGLKRRSIIKIESPVVSVN